MGWVKIALMVTVVLLFGSNISIAETYNCMYLSVIKADTPELISSSLKYTKQPIEILNGCIIKNKEPAYITSQIEEIARAQKKVGNCI